MSSEPANVIVTGGAGYIGSHTCKELAAQGFRPIVIDDLSTGHADFVKWGPLLQARIQDTPAVLAAFNEYKPIAVFHFAASASVGESMQSPQAYYDNNVVGSISLLTAMRESGCQHMIFSSTCAVYGWPQSVPIPTDHPTKPINPYGSSKLMVEQILADCAAADNLSVANLRYFNAAGADADCEVGERHDPETHLIPNAIHAALGQAGPLKVFGDDYDTEDGTCIRDYIHVRDLAAAHVAALDLLLREQGVHTFNLGAQQGTSVKQIIAAVERQSGQPVPVRIVGRRAGDPAELIADGTIAQQQLGWRPRYSDIDTIIDSALQWALSAD